MLREMIYFFPVFCYVLNSTKICQAHGTDCFWLPDLHLHLSRNLRDNKLASWQLHGIGAELSGATYKVYW